MAILQNLIKTSYNFGFPTICNNICFNNEQLAESAHGHSGFIFRKSRSFIKLPPVRLCEVGITNSTSNIRSERTQSHICYLKSNQKWCKFGRNRFI